MKVAAVIVTYNRCELLLQCLDAVFAQDGPIDRIIVIDNASTDSTEQVVTRLAPSHASLHYVRLPTNLGGAGGFSAGIRAAYQQGADWMWLMDDDTVAEEHALTRLIAAVVTVQKVGFACSRVLWKDGSVHRMNLPQIQSFSNSGEPFNSLEPYLQVNACSFVSVLIARDAVREVGLPYKEFFIWGDDIEYTDRITRSGFLGLYVGASMAKHLTLSNYSVDWTQAAESDAWKFRHDTRNQLFLIKSRGWRRYLRRLWRMIIFAFRLRMGHPARPALARAVLAGALESVRFNPRIDRVS